MLAKGMKGPLKEKISSLFGNNKFRLAELKLGYMACNKIRILYEIKSV